jgi:dsRNA-specific ribonuclease
VGSGTGRSKKEAEQSAARSAPEQLKKREKKEHARTGRQGMLEI